MSNYLDQEIASFSGAEAAAFRSALDRHIAALLAKRGSATANALAASTTGLSVMRPVGTHEVQSNALVNFAQAANRPGTYKTRHRIASSAAGWKNLKIWWENASIISGGDGNVGSLTNMTLTAGIEVGGTVYPLTFGGSATVVIAPLARVTHDPLSPAVEAAIRANGYFWVHTQPAMAGDAQWPVGLVTYADRDEGNNFATGGDATAGGAIPQVFAFAYGPSFMVADVPAVTRSFCLAGDSILFGQGNTPQDRSYFEHALNDEYGVLKLARPGETAAQFNHGNPLVWGRRKALAAAYPASDLYWAYGSNDADGGRTFAQLKADATAGAAFGRAAGYARVGIGTVLPRVATTDQCKTIGNQTPIANTPMIQTFNAWLRGGGDGLFDYVVDAAAAVEEGGAAAPTGKWRVNGAAQWLTVDGIHPSPYGHSGPLRDRVLLDVPGLS